LSHRYCYLPLSAGSSNGVTNTRNDIYIYIYIYLTAIG
jgi:hypothetical protein